MVDSAVDVDDERIIRGFILDDHELVRRGFTDLLDFHGRYGGRRASHERRRGAVTYSGRAAGRRLTRCAPAGWLRDRGLPRHPLLSSEVSCVSLTSFDDEEALFAAVIAGASGYLLRQIGGSSLVDGSQPAARWWTQP